MIKFLLPALIFITPALAQKVSLSLAGEKPKVSKYAAPVPPKTIPKEAHLPDPGKGRTLKLAFSDDFDGTTIDPKKWRVRKDQKRFNGFWLQKNASLDGKGHLLLTTTRDIDGDKITYAGTALETKSRFEQTHGYFVCRAKLHQHSGDGYHCSFWLQSDGVGKEGNDGRDGTEIDIIENFKKDDMINHALHWDGYGDAHAKCVFTFPWPKIKENFHLFALLWTPEEYVFYLDGVETWRTKAGGVSQANTFIRLTTEFSQGWNGDIKKAKGLPDTFTIDYVRAYSLESK